jgi:hypothetical protein
MLSPRNLKVFELFISVEVLQGSPADAADVACLHPGSSQVARLPRKRDLLAMNVSYTKVLINFLLLVLSSITESHRLRNARRCASTVESPAQQLAASSANLFQPITSNNPIQTNLSKMIAISSLALTCVMPCHALASDGFTGNQYTQSSTQNNGFQKSSKKSLKATDAKFDNQFMTVDGTFILAISNGREDNIVTNQALKSGVLTEGGIEKFLIPSETEINKEAKHFKLCYAPTTRKISNIFLTDISTVYTTEKEKSELLESEIGKTNTEKGRKKTDKINEENNNSDDRNSIKSVSSHLFISNSLIGSHWISIQGKYEKISEILCRVTWENIWLDNLSQKNGPSGILEKEKHENPELVQLLGSRLAFPNSSKFPDLYSVYSPCLFR